MKKVFFIVLMVLIVMLIVSPAQAVIVRYSGTDGPGPYGLPTCYCNEVGMTCECILLLPL